MDGRTAAATGPSRPFQPWISRSILWIKWLMIFLTNEPATQLASQPVQSPVGEIEIWALILTGQDSYIRTVPNTLYVSLGSEKHEDGPLCTWEPEQRYWRCEVLANNQRCSLYRQNDQKYDSRHSGGVETFYNPWKWHPLEHYGWMAMILWDFL